MIPALQKEIPVIAFRACLLPAALLSQSVALFAQAPAQPAAPGNPMYLEWGITAGMIALAVFVVSRKSNRT